MNDVMMSVRYVMSAQYFWLSMGMMAAMAMFVGAIIYDGEMKAATKGIIGVGGYAFFLWQIIFSRIYGNYAFLSTFMPRHVLYSNLVTIVITMTFWVFGVLVGVGISYFVRCKYRKECA